MAWHVDNLIAVVRDRARRYARCKKLARIAQINLRVAEVQFHTAASLLAGARKNKWPES